MDAVRVAFAGGLGSIFGGFLAPRLGAVLTIVADGKHARASGMPGTPPARGERPTGG